MHLLIPFAAPLSEAGQSACRGLALPNLARLLARWTCVARDAGEAFSLSTPQERALAAAWGWTGLADGLLPWAAVAASDDGLAPSADHDGQTTSADHDGQTTSAGGPSWGLVQLCHWHADAQQVAVSDPAGLRLDEAGARCFFDALLPLFGDDGWSLHWGSATRWYARHASLATLPTASLDRVIGRDVDIWLQSHPDARKLRRLQAEAQMLLHAHPLNAERDAQGLPAVNSFWLSGTGVSALPDPARRAAISVDARLRAPALAEDWAAWGQAWQALDAELLPAWLDRPAQAPTLTLCGERGAQSWAPQARPLWRRWLGPRLGNPALALAAL